MRTNPPVIDELVHDIVKTVHPLRIILFGSAVRGDMTADSDIDLLVVMPDGTHRRQTARMIRRHLCDSVRPVDVVVATETDLHQYGNNFSLVYYPALREGKVIYAG